MTAKKYNMVVVSCLLAGALVWGLIWYPYRSLQTAGVGGVLSSIVIMLSELVVAAVSSYFLAFEQIGWRDWLGGAMLVVAALCSGRLEASAHG